MTAEEDAAPAQRSGHRPTLRDVARYAGVSIKTVSRVVNEEPFVSAATTARVQKAVRALGYRRDHIASTLKRTHTSATIGLVVADIANPFYSVVTRTVEKEAFEAGHLLITVSSDEDPHREREIIDQLCERRIDGLLIASAGSQHRHLQREVSLGTSIVFFDRPPVGLQADAVLLDNHRGATLAVEHLIARGHRRIAVISDLVGVYTTRERVRGYRDALAGAGLPFDDRLVRYGLHDPRAAQADVELMLARPDPPTAFFATNNRICVGAVEALAGRPEVGLVGFDDFELAGALTRPVTVVAYDLPLMARTATERLLRRMEGDRGAPRRIVVPTHLVLRD